MPGTTHPVPIVSVPFSVVIDYDQSLADMVKSGEYDYDYTKDNMVAKNFPVEGTGVVESELVLVHFDRDIPAKIAIKKLRYRRLVLGKIEHLLALGAKYPELQCEYYINCPGALWLDPFGRGRVPWLYSICGNRYLNLCWWNDVWHGDWHFLAVRKS